MVKASKTVRSLGVWLVQHISMIENVDRTCHTSFADLPNISRLWNGLDSGTCRMLIPALVLSRIEYCFLLYWGIKKKL
jgi:hypothetical protein